jgi:hypothetical protein
MWLIFCVQNKPFIAYNKTTITFNKTNKPAQKSKSIEFNFCGLVKRDKRHQIEKFFACSQSPGPFLFH